MILLYTERAEAQRVLRHERPPNVDFAVTADAYKVQVQYELAKVPP